MEKRHGAERDPAVLGAVTGLAHREVVGERDAGYAGRLDATLHREGYGGYAPLFDGLAYQADGPVAQRSGGRQEHDAYAVLGQPVGYFGGRLFY